jgi:hypothetical protein
MDYVEDAKYGCLENCLEGLDIGASALWDALDEYDFNPDEPPGYGDEPNYIINNLVRNLLSSVRTTPKDRSSIRSGYNQFIQLSEILNTYDVGRDVTMHLDAIKKLYGLFYYISLA